MQELDRLYSKILDDDIVDQVAKMKFNPDVWLNWYTNYKTYENYFALKALRRVISKQTVDCCLKGRYKFNDQIIQFCELDVVRLQAQNTKFYDFTLNNNFKVDLEANWRTKVCVYLGDCLDAALGLKEEGFNPLVLNMASPARPGGGYKSGAGAQEENLFRRTNYFQSLEDKDRLDSSRKWTYPLGEFSGIYSPSVLIFRSSEQTGYAFLPKPIEMSFVAVPAYRRPALTESRLTDKFAEGTKKKMRLIFYIALLNGHDSLVLSAMGCGAFRNPPKHIAQLFLEVMSEEIFRGKLKHILFAIIDDKNTGMKHNPEGNYEPFRSVFAELPEGFEVVRDPFPALSLSRKEKRRMEKEEEILISPPKEPQNLPKNSLKTKKTHTILPNEPPSTDTLIFFCRPNKPNGFLSPFFKSKFTLHSQTYDSVIQYVYEKKFNSSAWATTLQKLKMKPMEILDAAETDEYEVAPGWESAKEKLMEEGTLAKFVQNGELMKYLLETHPKELVFYHPNGFWGGVKDGCNIVGKLLLSIRASNANKL